MLLFSWAWKSSKWWEETRWQERDRWGWWETENMYGLNMLYQWCTIRITFIQQMITDNVYVDVYSPSSGPLGFWPPLAQVLIGSQLVLPVCSGPCVWTSSGCLWSCLVNLGNKSKLPSANIVERTLKRNSEISVNYIYINETLLCGRWEEFYKQFKSKYVHWQTSDTESFIYLRMRWIPLEGKDLCCLWLVSESFSIWPGAHL